MVDWFLCQTRRKNTQKSISFNMGKAWGSSFHRNRGFKSYSRAIIKLWISSIPFSFRASDFGRQNAVSKFFVSSKTASRITQKLASSSHGRGWNQSSLYTRLSTWTYRVAQKELEKNDYIYKIAYARQSIGFV